MKWPNFTAERVSSELACEPGKKQSIHWDGKQPGLGLRVTAGGARSYIFEATLKVPKGGDGQTQKGKTVRITIGSTRTYTVAEAQRIAAAYKKKTNDGIDPRQEAADKLSAAQSVRQQAQADAEAAQTEQRRRNVTLGEVWPLYVAARKSKWSAGHLQNHMTLAASGGEPKKRGKGLTVAAPLAPLMPLPLVELTHERIAAWLEQEAADRPTNAAQSYRLLRAFIRWAADVPAYRGIVTTDAYSARMVRDVLPKSQAKDGDSLQREQCEREIHPTVPGAVAGGQPA